MIIAHAKLFYTQHSYCPAFLGYLIPQMQSHIVPHPHTQWKDMELSHMLVFTWTTL